MFTTDHAFTLEEIEKYKNQNKKDIREKNFMIIFSFFAICLSSGTAFFIADLLLHYEKVISPFYENLIAVVLAIMVGSGLGFYLSLKLKYLQEMIDYGADRLIPIDACFDYDLAKKAETFFAENPQYKNVLEEVNQQRRRLFKGELDDLISFRGFSCKTDEMQSINRKLYG